jgi:c-di-GMP-binding flagellar brake protein YcgR
MDSNVPSSRIVCEARCILNFDGFDFEGVIVNLSLSGALIELNDMIPDDIHPDSVCDLMFRTNPDLYPIKYTCKVIRVDSKMIGLQFLELSIM